MASWINKHRNALGFAACILIVAGGFLALGIGLERNKQAAEANKRAIFVGCVLLTNVVIQSGVNTQGSSDSTMLFIRAIQRVMTPEEREQFKAAVAEQRPAARVTVPPCKRISEHPEEVQAVPLPRPSRTAIPRPPVTATPTPTPSPTPTP